ncbi:hypothetical protein EPR50_G00021250 [Perca flavescens]|uniref:VPS37 C-terminal domain-containing protein n=2 Tax=Perca flavescens TaxID=8167 RepID=A0A484DMA6_PERFV|nr:hypothetical protein EPR50_G00021250 [Perca flavescens]
MTSRNREVVLDVTTSPCHQAQSGLLASAILANQMEKLQDLSQSELQELLDNPQRVESMALESDEIQNIQLEREMALASNRSLAEQNLDVKPRLEVEKEVLVERYSQLEAIRETYRQHCSLRDGMVGQVSPEALFSRLQTEGSKTEAESETLADEFLEGSLPLDSFLDRFLSLRSLAHKRRVRIEKLQEILRQRSEGNPNAMTSSAGVTQDPAAAPSPWNQPTTTATTTNQQQPNSTAQSCSYPSQPASASAAGPSGLPYTPYPVSPPNPPPAAAAGSGAINPTPHFHPYPGSGSPFTPAGSYSGPRPAFGPTASAACPYPSQPSFPTPHPGSAFGQYTPSPPQSGPAPYPASYSYGGYSYPAGPPYSDSQSPTGRPIYRPGYGVPQPYS